MDESFVKEKERFYELFEFEKNYPKALKHLEEISLNKDEELEKIQRLEIYRLEAKVYWREGRFHKANSIYYEATNINEQQLLSLWRDWTLMSIEAYKKTNNK